MRRKGRRQSRNWTRLFKTSDSRGDRPRRKVWAVYTFVLLWLYALIKVVAAPSNFFGLWLSQFLETLEGLLHYLADTILSPVGLILIAFIWLIKTGDLYQLLNKIRYMRLKKGDAPAVNVSPYSAEAGDVDAKPLNAWQRATLGDIERTGNPEEQQYKLAQLVAYEQLSGNPVLLPLLQFLHYYRRDDISFYQVAQFLAGEGLMDKDQLSGQELDVESAVLGYISYLQHAGLADVHATLQPAPDGFYGTIHKVKIPQHVQDVMELFHNSD